MQKILILNRTATKKQNKPRRDNHYQPFSFDDFT